MQSFFDFEQRIISLMLLIILSIIFLQCRTDEKLGPESIIVPPEIEIPPLQIISPTSSDIWLVNTSHEIRWSPATRVLYYKIDLYRKNYFKMNISPATEDDGSYLWEIPENLPKSIHYRIKFTNTRNVSDTTFSDYFSIR